MHIGEIAVGWNPSVYRLLQRFDIENALSAQPTLVLDGLAIVVVAETEIWPNLFNEAKRIGCGLLMVTHSMRLAAWPGVIWPTD